LIILKRKILLFETNSKEVSDYFEERLDRFLRDLQQRININFEFFEEA